jgi:1-hydroxycarotenoid 3,4-desaturase
VLDSGQRLDADAVVFNGDVNALSEGLLGEAPRTAVTDRRRETRSLSALTVSTSVRTSDFPLGYHSVFFGEDYPAEFASIFEQQTVCDDPTVYVCAQDRIEGPPTKENERLFFLINAPPRAHSPRERERLVERLFGVLERQGFCPYIGDTVVTDPTEFGERFPGTSGAIYGWPTHGVNGTFRRSGSRSHINGLYLAGGSVHPGPGIPMVALSGRIAANALREDAKR